MNAPYAAGGCARDQSSTQYCAEAAGAHRRIAELEAALRELADQAAEMIDRLDAVFDAEAEAVLRARKLVNAG